MQDLSELIESARQDFAQAEQPAALEDAKAKYIGKSGAVTALMKSLGQLAPEERRARGQEINKAKAAIEAALNARREQLAQAAMQAKLASEAIDVTLPGRVRTEGGIHPVMRTWMRIEEIFRSIGFDGPEVTSMGTGLISMLLSLAYVKLVGVRTPEEFRHHAAAQQRKYSAFRAMSPYIYMLVLLPLIRYGFPAVVENGFAIMCTFGYIFWVDLVILVCGILGALTLGVDFKTYKAVCKRTASGVLPVLITMGSLLIVAYIMQSSSTGMMNLLASDIAAVVGRFYPAAAVLIGSSGAFITGTGLGSNIMFAQMHIDAAASRGMNPITSFAGQNAGASLGNLICPNNTVAACATVDQVGNESEVMKKTFKAFAIILVLYMVLAMLYTCVLFPNFGM